ncbi:MAG TPA: TlyA family RNA methyltransferase [Candidatus Acidoferrum sp.]|jgi:23S rRNA (cytidine1920-2'-O)/16S rRNA (cytidine1409-2'-O)-methyltransferase|nr:TlyA family RNA methyltransferase [Candidatus Acidoferrum sp.]
MKPKPGRQRLDHLLVERGLAESLPKATAMVLAGEVQVDGMRAEKAGMPIASDAEVAVTSRLEKYASRGGFKLEGALEDFAFNPARLVCLDIGSSHGGFTDCLLQRGAARVYAVDVNVEQLDWKLSQDPRVIRIKRNARELRNSDIPELVDLVVIDVSFISACKVVAPAARVAKSDAELLVLVKPQFELPREEIGRGGIVADKKLHEKAILAVRRHVESLGFETLGVRPSRIPGAEGNQEYFLHARKSR